MSGTEPYFDLIAIGGGLAGLVCANRAAQLGLRVAVLEKNPQERYLCSSRVATGAFAVMGQTLKSSEEAFYSAIMSGTDGAAQADLAQMVASNVRRAHRWLLDEGARFIDLSTLGGHSVLAPPRRLKHGLDWEGRGADVLMRILEQKLANRGGQLLRGCTAESLKIENETCVGVEVLKQDGHTAMSARAIVIADGGFQANQEMVSKYIARRPDRILLRAPAASCGDGIRMAEAAGAAVGGFGKFYGHIQHRDAMTNSNLWPYPQLDGLAEMGVLVGADGKRFTDEGLGGVAMANAITQLEDPLSSAIIFDEANWTGAGGKAAPVPANPYLFNGGATIYSAPTIEGLAHQIGISVEGLTETVRQHNGALESETYDRLSPARTVGTYQPWSSAALFKHSARPQLISMPPFHAIPACAGITLTMGGIRINTHAQALRPSGDPINGLYVTGTPVWGLEGGARAGYVGGLCKAFVLGLVVAEHCAAQQLKAA